MAEETLAKAGLYFDELNKIRILNPQASQQCTELKDESGEFLGKIKSFQSVVENFILLIDALSKQVEQEKLRAIGSRNLLKTITKQKEDEIQQLQILCREKQIELERLRLQYDSLKKEEAEQKEFLQQFLMTS